MAVVEGRGGQSLPMARARSCSTICAGEWVFPRTIGAGGSNKERLAVVACRIATDPLTGCITIS